MTNSRPSLNNETVLALCSDYGLDTVRFRWRNGADISGQVYEQFRHRRGGYLEGQRGEIFTQTPLGRVSVFRDGMVSLEGRVSALVVGSPDEHRLAAVHELPSAERVAQRVAQDNGAYTGADSARLGRLDLASELRFARGDAGRAFLHALSTMDVPWCKSRTDGRKGDGIETVSFHGTRGKTIYLRAYDKGVESETAPPGERIRVERQKRFRKTREPDVFDITSANLHSMYVGREFRHLVDLPTATVTDVPGALQTLWERAETPQQAERMAGYIVMGSVLDYERPTRYRRAAELRSLGICVDHTQTERVEVPVGRYLETLAAVWAA